MHHKEFAWHGYGEDWVPHFVREYQIEINTRAWSGYLTHGKGMLICEVDCPAHGRVWDLKTVRHHVTYYPAEASIEHLERLELSQDVISHLSHDLLTYNPSQEVVLLLTGKGEILVLLLRHHDLEELYEQYQARVAIGLPSMSSGFNRG